MNNTIIGVQVTKGTSEIQAITVGSEGDKRHLTLEEAKELYADLGKAIELWEGK